jgi:uncharacterized protein (TIGR02246 family)
MVDMMPSVTGRGKIQRAFHRKIEQSAASAEKTWGAPACDGYTHMRVDTRRQEHETPSALPDAMLVRTLYTQLTDGWNAGNGEAFATPFAEQCDFIAFDGARFRSRDEIVRFHEPLFRTHLRGTRLVGEVTDVRFLTADVALMHARGGTIPRGGTRPAPERDSVQTLVARHENGTWRLVAFHNTRVRPIGRNARGTLLWLISDWFWKWCLPKQTNSHAS